MNPTAEEVKQMWNAFASTYVQVLEKTNLQLGLSLTRMLQIDSAKNIVEIGCGSGILAVDLLQTLPKGVKYTSIDISEEMIKTAEARKQALASKLNEIDHKFVLTNGEDLSFIPDESIDVYFSPLCLHLTPDPDKALKEAMRVLKKGGKIGFSVLGSYDRCEFFKIFDDSLREFNIEFGGRRSMFRFGEREALIKLAQDNGFEVDFCWIEQVTVGIYNEDEVEVISTIPVNTKLANQKGEEIRDKIMASLRNRFAERKKAFLPLQNDNTLLVGRKPL